MIQGRSHSRAAWRLALAAALLLAGPLGGQQRTPADSAALGRAITFDEAMRIALRQNTTLRSARNAAALDTVAVRQQRGQFLPDLRFSTQTSMSNGRYFSQSEGQVLNQTTGSVNSGVSSSVVLFDGAANRAALRGARWEETAGGFEVQRARQTVVFTVLSGFLALVEQQEQLRVQRENLASQEAQEQQVRTYVNAGVRPISDLYQQQATVASARLAVVQADRAWQIAKLDLIRALRLDPAREYTFVAPPLDTTRAVASAAPALPPLDTLIARALANRADLDAAEARIESARQAVRVANASRWPSVSLSAGYNTGYSSASDFGFRQQLDQRRGGSLGLNFSLPIFDRFNRSTSVQRARIQEENARLSEADLRQSVAVEVRRAYLDRQAAEAQLAAADAQFRAAELATAATRQRYEAGAATLLELTQARAALVQAASNRVAARYGLRFQERVIGYYLGELDAGAAAM